MRLRRLGLLLLVVLTGCSSTTFLYNRLDFLIPWYMSDYVKLNRQQRITLDELLEPFLAWHREEELEQYLALFTRIEADLEGRVSGKQVAARATEFIAAWERIEARALEWMLVLGESLSDEQVDQFVENLRDKQREYEEEYLPRSDQKYRDDAYENLLDSAQDFMGRLDWGQRAILEEAAAGLRRSDGIWLEERERWVSRIEEQLQRKPGWQQGIRDMLADREESTSVEYREVYEHNAGIIYRALAKLLNTRTEKQDGRLFKEIGDLREDLETLML